MAAHSRVVSTATLPKGWRSPMEVSVYDRAPEVFPHEMEALCDVLRRAGKSGWSPDHEKRLARLLRPVRDAFAYLREGRGAARGITPHLCREMHDRRQAYWSWATEEWSAVINSCPRVEHCRGDFLGLAYLLCDSCEIYRFGAFYQPKLAAKVFGRAAVARTMEKVRDEFIKIDTERLGLRSSSEPSPSCCWLAVAPIWRT